MEYIQFMAIVTLVTLCQATPSCSDNQVYHLNGNCCQYVSCEPQQFVKVCENNGEADVCQPCPEGTYLDDRTDSNFVFDCLEKNCGEDTIPSDYPATKFDNTACAKRCRCNTAKNYCGTNPCQCRHHLCVHPEEVLQENCTCIRKEKGIDDTNLITPSTTSSTKVQEIVSQLPTTGPTINFTSFGRSEIANDTRNEEETEINKPGWNPPGNDEPTSVPYWLILLIVLTSTCITVLSLAVFYKRRGNGVTIYHSVNNHDTVHNYEHCNVQVGNKNNLTVCNMGENDKDNEPTE